MEPPMTDMQQSRQHLFLRVYTLHEPAVRAFVRRLVPTRADADDVMQDVSVVLWEKFDSFRQGADFRAWAFGIARYEVLAWLRDKGRDRLVLDDAVVNHLADETTCVESRLCRQREALETCLQKLNPDQQALLMRAYQPDVQIQEVARTSGRSVTGFYQWLHRLRRLLMDCVRQELGAEGN